MSESRAQSLNDEYLIGIDKLGRPLETDIGGATTAATKYYALLIANDEMTGDNDKMRTGMLNWDSWKTTGTITLKDDLSGPGIIKEIKKWVAGIGPDDVAVFHYTGHSGVRKDVGGEERFNDPVDDNDVDYSAPLSWQKRRRDDDEVIGKLGPQKIFPVSVTDDEIQAELGALPAETTLVAVFATCLAFGHAGGTSDTSALINTAVVASCAENRKASIDSRGGMGWNASLFLPLFDRDGDGSADADGNGDGQITAQEWFDRAKTADSSSQFTSNLAGPAIRPIFTGLNNEQTAPTIGGVGVKDAGEDGSGLCSDHDWGDAPDNGQVCAFVPRFYKSTFANDGPRYNEWTFQRLGAKVDPGGAVLPGCPAGGDDTDASGDDEDGIFFFGPPVNAVSVTVRIDHVQVRDYRLDAWFDANDNGTFDEPSEHLIDSQTNGLLTALSTGTYVFFYPLTVNPLDVYSRFRLTFGVNPSTVILSTGEYVGPDGASHGEVEDYAPGFIGGALGACCEPDGTCVHNLTQAVCDGLHGTYQGDDSFCGTVVCEPAPTGACCLPDGACIDTIIEGICDDAEGTYHGDDTTCLGDSNGDGVDDGCPGCGNNIREGDEQCDGTDDAVCPGDCLADCRCSPGTKIPTVSEWGLIVMVLLVLTAGTVVVGRRRRSAA